MTDGCNYSGTVLLKYLSGQLTGLVKGIMVDLEPWKPIKVIFLNVDANRVSGSHVLELRTYCHPGAPSMPSILLPGSLGLGKDK